MTDIAAPVAVQTTNQPTNKLATGTQASGAIAGVLAGILSAYGGDAIKEILEPLPLGPASENLIVLLFVGVCTWYATQAGGRAAAYNVLDKPNVPIAMAPSPAPTVLSHWLFGVLALGGMLILSACGPMAEYSGKLTGYTGITAAQQQCAVSEFIAASQEPNLSYRQRAAVAAGHCEISLDDMLQYLAVEEEKAPEPEDAA